jgi:hypothetical protein
MCTQTDRGSFTKNVNDSIVTKFMVLHTYSFYGLNLSDKNKWGMWEKYSKSC